MSRFYLNIHQDGLAHPRLLAAHENVEAVCQEARTVFVDLIRNIVTGPANVDWQMEVRNDTGGLIYKINLSVDSIK